MVFVILKELYLSFKKYIPLENCKNHNKVDIKPNKCSEYFYYLGKNCRKLIINFYFQNFCIFGALKSISLKFSSEMKKYYLDARKLKNSFDMKNFVSNRNYSDLHKGHESNNS